MASLPSSDGVRRLRVRAPGVPDFEIELDASATVADAKVAATCGCDVDPEAMRVIVNGKVLPDDAMLEGCSVMHIARGRPNSAAALTSANAEAPAKAEALAAGAVQILRLLLKGPGGVEHAFETPNPNVSVAEVRQQAANKCGLDVERVHLVHKGRILGDAETLAGCGICCGDVVRVARKASAQDAPSVPSSVQAFQSAPGASASANPLAMPMAWGGSASLSDQARTVTEAFFAANPNARTLNAELAQGLEQMLQARQAAEAIAPAANLPPSAPATVGVASARQRLAAQEDAQAARLAQEVRAMTRQVRALAAERLRETPRNGPGAFARPQEGGSDDEGDEDPELVADIARTMAEARARGAPVPNAERFVERALRRAEEARAAAERRRREAADMDPELEDAVAAAELSIAAAARAPRRLDGPAPAPR